MFKLESYITPIILNHVAKYVKNIRPEDSQVSLWEGEVAFQNLDLRLDVLEEELNLPFEFLSGHIHELSIQVPWLKINSEPIKITINTIEFVLKLKDAKADATVSPKRMEKKKRLSKVEEQQQQGYMPGLVNKIINNIVINCHNIILKYVEEDIVVSMNIQLLSLHSADEFWKPAFTDIHPIKVFMRKLIQVSDLTICLDKRNAAGQIDVCQEPILYRCSLEIRVVRKYNVTSVDLGSTTKIAIFTKLMEMNVSSLQFPMAMRLFKLLLALKSGELKSRSSSDINDDEADRDQENVANVPNSFINWAWNLIPNLGFNDIEDEERVEDEASGQVMDIGVYIETLNFTLKSSEFITDSIVGATKKIRYSPIVRLSLGGIYSETMIIADKDWSNTKAGCSSISIEPLDAYKEEEADIISIVTTPALRNRSFLDRSLFDETFIEKDWIVSTYEDYNVRITDKYLLYRSPVFAFDLVEYKENPKTDGNDTEVETDDDRIRVIYRFLASRMTLRYSQTYTRIANVLQELIRAYDYPPYSDEKLETTGGSPKLHPPLLDDFDSLMNGIPLKVYKFNLSAIQFEFYPKTEQVSLKPVKKLSVASKKGLPYFKFSIDSIEGQLTTPMYPDKLVHTTCQLPDKPIELLNACYNNAQMRFKNISLTLNQASDSSEMISIPRATLTFGELLQPSLWKNEEVPMRKLELSFESIILEFSITELTTALRLVDSLSEFDSEKIKKMANQTPRMGDNLVKIRSQFKKLTMELKKYRTSTMYRGSLKALQAITLRPGNKGTEQDTNNVVLTTVGGGQRKHWLDCYVQIPSECANNVCPKSITALWTEEYHLHVDENLVDFLKAMETPQPQVPAKETTTEPVLSTRTLIKQSSRKSINSERQSRRICCPEETVHLSSERDEKVNVEKNGDKEMQDEYSYGKILQYVKNMVVKVQIAQGVVTVTSGINQRQSKFSKFTQITLPKIVFSSSVAESINRYNIQNEFQTNTGKSPKDTFPWSCGICDFSIVSSCDNVVRTIIHPIQTSVTVALTHKKETLNVPKVEPQHQPKPTEDTSKTDKSDQSILSSQNSESKKSDEFLEKSMPDSISANGRSATSEENDHANKASEKKRSYFQEAVETVFTTRRRPQRDVVAVSLHVDTSPIHIEFDTERTQFIHDHLGLLMKVINFLQKTDSSKPAVECHRPIKIVTNNEEDTHIKQFMEMETNSDSSFITADKPVSKFTFSILFQWTFTKFIVELDAVNKSKCKLVLDMEDLLTSLDKREEFTKFTFKVGTMNLRFFEADEHNALVVSDRLNIKVQSDSTQSPLFNMVITSVGVINFLKKIGAKPKEVDPLRTIAEVIIKMEAIEMILDMDKLAILTTVLTGLMGPEKNPKEVEPISKKSLPCTTSELPMIHLESKGLTVYLPVQTRRTWCSVSILKIEAIKISPNLENPLQRSPIRMDVFQKAAQMGILGIPGSMIEDRQYEITFQNISAATANWNEILTYMKEHSDNFHSTNPAFEWNNQSRKTSLDIRKMFSNFTFITTYAPCITCNNVLICGQALEFNCSNDLIISLTTDQMSLFSCTSDSLQSIIASMEHKPVIPKTSSRSMKSSDSDTSKSSANTECKNCHFTITASCTKIKDFNPSSSDVISEKLTTDSGISLERKSIGKKSSKATVDNCQQECVRLMPHTITFVAGMFIINLYSYERNIHGIPQGDEIRIEEILTPLISVILSQPSYLACQSVFEVTQRFSLFNLTLNLHHAQDHKLLNKKNTPEVLFDTSRGEKDSSGIPPPLVVMNSRKSKSGRLDVDISFSKPMTIRLSRSALRSLTKHAILCYETFSENPCPNIRTEKPLIRATKIQTIKNMFLNADHFNCKLNMISLKLSERDLYSLKATVVDLRFTAKFQTRPEKVNAKGSIGGIYMQSHGSIAVHPIGVKCNVDLMQEAWNRLPIVMINVKFNVIHCDIGMEMVHSLHLATDALNKEVESCNRRWQAFMSDRYDESDEQMDPDRLIKVTLPAVELKSSAKPKEEFYQDDLRAGAFQFVEMDSDELLPIPYQIQIIKKDFGIICWRYPQPRKMSSIHVFPVPMPSSNPIRIKCRMEYFSDVHEGFLHYCDFALSETVSKVIELPRHEITANIWRVVILQSLVSVNQECFDTLEDEDELRSIMSISIDEILNSVKKESDFILHPKVLVGCMRIDTIFQPSAIPKMQLLINLNEIQLNFQNIQNVTSKLPHPLKKLKLSTNYKPINQTFLSFCIEKTNIHTSFHSLEHFSVHSETLVSIKCLDHGYLHLIHIMEPTDLAGSFHMNKATGTMSSEINADKLTLQVGPSILHNLLCAKQNWEKYFDEESDLRQTFIISKFIIGNRTNTNIRFGQSGTDERILLQAKECCKYSFQSDRFNQELTFYIQDNEDNEQASNSLVMTFDFPENSERKVSHVLIDNKCLAIRTRKMSATQFYILIKGQIEILSMVKDPFTMEIYDDDIRTEHGTVDVPKNARFTLLQPVTLNTDLFIRLRLQGDQGKGQTGNIPLKASKSFPWLVKVPVSGPEKFISYWIRIVRECIPELRTETFHPQKILIIIWPIFEIRSMLTTELSIRESTTKEGFVIRPHGRIYELRVPATHLTDHQLTFLEKFHTAPPFNLTLKAIDWNKFFWYNEDVWTVEHILTELAKPISPKWPLSDEEELRIRRTSLPNCNTTLVYKCAPSREFSCTLCLEIGPWGMFINETALKIRMQWDTLINPIEITSNAIAMLPQITSEFTIMILCGQKWTESLPIVFNKSTDVAKRKCYRIDENEAIDVEMFSYGKIYKFYLEFCTENGRNVFILKPKYVVANNSKYQLGIYAFTLDSKDTVTREEIRALTHQKSINLPVMSTLEYSIGSCMDGFFDLHAGRSIRCPDVTFAFFVSIRAMEKSELSIPIRLMNSFNRKCFSVQFQEKSIAFSASLLEKNGQYFLNIFDDASPTMLLSNRTDLTLVVAQTYVEENTKVHNTIPEYDAKHIEWHQIIRPRSKLYYTPPSSYLNFPDVDSSTYRICIALYVESRSRKRLNWSKAISIDASWEKFLHVPAHGDVKVVVCDKHRITRVSIHYIAQQLEFSVKELRSRLLAPQSSVSLESRDHLTQAQYNGMEYNNDALVEQIQPDLKSLCIHHSSGLHHLPPNPPFNFKLNVKEINLKIFVECKTIDYLKREIFALYIDGFHFAYENRRRTLKLLISNLQIDNQLFSSGNYDFPVILCSQTPYKPPPNTCPIITTSTALGIPSPNLAEVTVCLYDDEMKVRSIACRVNPIRAYIEDTYLNDLLDYLVDCTPSNVVVSLKNSDFYVDLAPGEFLIPKDIVAQALYLSEPFRMQYFRIDAMNVMLSVHTCVRLYIALDHSPLQFSTYERRDVLTLPLRFGHTLGMHYLSGALFGAGWVVGSLEMLGSPSGLARSFSVGLKDFVSMPVQGLLRGPWGFVVGVAQGSASLLRNITAGTVNSVSKLAASVSRNLDRLTLDQEHIQRTEALRRCRPQGFTEGFTQGITGLGISILGAVGGIARHTLEARSPGQVVAGMGKGIVGAFAKPISGAAELVALTGQGVLHTVGFNAMPQQKMPSAPKNIAAQVSEQKIWNLLVGVLSNVIDGDQILFCHDVALRMHEKIIPGYVFLTSSIFGLYDVDQNRFAFITPIQRLEITIAPNDKTVLNISVKKQPNELEEDSFYTTHRIMTFLQTSNYQFGMNTTIESLDDMLKDHRYKNRSLHISEHLGQYLVEYVKIINTKKS